MESQILQIQNKALTVKARVPHNIELDDKKVKVQVWDTAGQ